MLLFNLVISCIPSTNSLSKSFLLIYPLPDQLPVDELNERLVFQRLPVVHVSRGDHEVKQFPTFVAYQVELEAEEPAHRAFASPGNALESLVNEDSLVFAHP